MCCRLDVASETKFAVRWLAATLPLGEGCFLGREVDWRASEHFVNVAAHDAAAVGAMPVALDDDRAAALGARLRWGFLQSRHKLTLHETRRSDFEDKEKDLEASDLLARPS